MPLERSGSLAFADKLGTLLLSVTALHSVCGMPITFLFGDMGK